MGTDYIRLRPAPLNAVFPTRLTPVSPDRSGLCAPVASLRRQGLGAGGIAPWNEP